MQSAEQLHLFSISRQRLGHSSTRKSFSLPPIDAFPCCLRKWFDFCLCSFVPAGCSFLFSIFLFHLFPAQLSIPARVPPTPFLAKHCSALLYRLRKLSPFVAKTNNDLAMSTNLFALVEGKWRVREVLLCLGGKVIESIMLNIEFNDKF